MTGNSRDLKKWDIACGRAQLKDSDFRFIESVLRGKGCRKTTWQTLVQDKDVLDQILDDEALVQTILELPGQLEISLNLYFYVLMRHTLLEAGIKNRALADYLVMMLITGLHVDGIFDVTADTSKKNFYLMDCLNEISEATAENQFYLRVALANRALLVTGLYEEHIRFREKRCGAPSLAHFEEVGGSQYSMANAHHLAEELRLTKVFEALGGSFSDVRKLLNTFSDRFISLGDPFIPKDKLIG